MHLINGITEALSAVITWIGMCINPVIKWFGTVPEIAILGLGITIILLVIRRK